MAYFEGRCPVLLQDYFVGTGHGVEVLLHEGRPLAAFQHQRLREVPISGGASALRQSVPLDPDLYEYSIKMLSALHWTGLAMVEFKTSHRGACLMEINGRVWGSLPLAIFSGVDFPVRLVEMLLFDRIETSQIMPTSYQAGVRAHNIQKEMSWIAAVLLGRHEYPFLSPPSRRQALRAIIDLLHPGDKYDVLSLEDVGPGLAQIWNILRNAKKAFKPLSM